MDTSSEALRVLALGLAVLHHGLANFATKAVPAGADTTLATAERFHKYLTEGTTDPK